MNEGREWRDNNETKDFPFYVGSSIPKNLIVDAIFFLDPPVILKSVSNGANFIEFNFSCANRGNIFWRINKSNPFEYMYNDFGKIIYSQKVFTDVPLGTTVYDSRILDTLCYPERNLAVQTLKGDITIERGDSTSVVTNVANRTISLSADEQLGFAFTGISKINGQDIPSQHVVLQGDNCVDILPFGKSSITLNDKCLPGCYQCNERLTEGDVHLFISDLEDRVTALEEE